MKKSIKSIEYVVVDNKEYLELIEINKNLIEINKKMIIEFELLHDRYAKSLETTTNEVLTLCDIVENTTKEFQNAHTEKCFKVRQIPKPIYYN